MAAAREDMCPPEEELVALKDRYARLLADFDNFRKRQAREREDWSRRANELLLEDFLPVVDHLELALGNAPDPSGPFAAGVGLVRDQFIAALEKHGVTPLDARGQPFDPDWHEALSQVPSDTVPEGGVIEQFRCGWCIGGRLMRPAQVIVSSGAPQG
ncbi:MAG: nucleotide exchange factor GrpE [Kiritimatiellaeota bacterium]|nr:nucleotide exchange factor GrpE [Kiritimatiellota bacterium]